MYDEFMRLRAENVRLRIRVLEVRSDDWQPCLVKSQITMASPANFRYNTFITHSTSYNPPRSQ
jgi:hypothetical protein